MNDEQIRQHPNVVRLLLMWDTEAARLQLRYNELKTLEQRRDAIAAAIGRVSGEAEKMAQEWRTVTPETLAEWAARHAECIAMIEAGRLLIPRYNTLLDRERQNYQQELEYAPGQRAQQALTLRAELLNEVEANPHSTNRERAEIAEIGKWLIQLAEGQRPGAYQAVVAATQSEHEMDRLARQREADDARQRAMERNERERNRAEFAREQGQ